METNNIAPQQENPETIQKSELSEKAESQKTKCTANVKLLTVLNIVLLLAVAFLCVCHFTGFGAPSGSVKNPDATPVVVPTDGAFKIGYVNTDSILAKYQYALDLEKGLRDFQTAKEKEYEKKMTDFQTDYQNYLKTGDKLTLTQQKAKEEELKKRAEKLSTLEQELTLQVQERQMNDNKKLLDAIYAFVREYNAANQQFDIILRQTYADPPTLYMNPAMEITDEIIEGLNKEYEEYKK